MTAAEIASGWLQRFYLLSTHQRRLHIIYADLDDWLSAGAFDVVTEILGQVDLEQLNISQMLGFAIFGRLGAQKKDLACYPAYYARLFEHLGKVDPERREALLKGLEP